jgi:hypothetical protein
MIVRPALLAHGGAHEQVEINRDILRSIRLTGREYDRPAGSIDGGSDAWRPPDRARSADPCEPPGVSVEQVDIGKDVLVAVFDRTGLERHRQAVQRAASGEVQSQQVRAQSIRHLPARGTARLSELSRGPGRSRSSQVRRPIVKNSPPSGPSLPIQPSCASQPSGDQLSAARTNNSSGSSPSTALG